MSQSRVASVWFSCITLRNISRQRSACRFRKVYSSRRSRRLCSYTQVLPAASQFWHLGVVPEHFIPMTKWVHTLSSLFRDTHYAGGKSCRLFSYKILLLLGRATQLGVTYTRSSWSLVFNPGRGCSRGMAIFRFSLRPSESTIVCCDVQVVKAWKCYVLSVQWGLSIFTGRFSI